MARPEPGQQAVVDRRHAIGVDDMRGADLAQPSPAQVALHPASVVLNRQPPARSEQ